MDINTIQDKIIAEFDNLSDKANIFTYFRYMGRVTKEDPSLNTAEKNNVNLVQGCKRKVWISANLKEGKIYFNADSENPIIKGMVNLILKVYSGHSPATIANTDLYFLHEIRLFNYLSSSGLKDFLAVLQRIKSLAVGHHLKSYSSEPDTVS